LSPAALDVLRREKEQKRPAGAAVSELVFPSSSGGPQSDMSMTAVLRRMNVDAVPHGFRSTFRDWAAERTNYPTEMCEIALAHAVGDKVMQAYLRSDMVEKRRKLMTAWAVFLSKPEAKATVVNIHSKTAA
jgi:integrase